MTERRCRACGQGMLQNAETHYLCDRCGAVWSDDTTANAHDARMARLTELARKVRPDAIVDCCENWRSDGGVYAAMCRGDGTDVISVDHPRALDILEAALEEAVYVPPTPEELAERERRYLGRGDHGRLKARLLSTVREWEKRADEMEEEELDVDRARALRWCASEIRRRAGLPVKEPPAEDDPHRGSP